MFKNDLRTAIFLAGLTQIAIAASSLAIPGVLHWREETARLLRLTRQVFWVYAGYIFSTNLAFGLLATLAPATLIDRSPLAAAVAGFIAVYWLARVGVQFAVYDRSAASRPLFVVAEILYVLAFLYLGIVYSVATALNAGWVRS
jgi:hypothetical protein